MNFTWYTISGIVSCLSSAVLLIPDTFHAVSKREVSLSDAYIKLKFVFIMNALQYGVSIGYTFGWYASTFVLISTSIQGFCLGILYYVKNHTPI